jgi:putative transport protein
VSWLAESLRAHPELALFLTLALGHALGRARVGTFKLNAVIGVLLAGVAIGQIGIDVPPALQWAFFVLFLFSIGYKTGPQFFRGLGRDSLPQVGLAVLLCVTGLATTYVVSRVFGFDGGAAAGLLAGALNASAAIGTANDAVAKLAIDDTARQALGTHLTVAFAVTYLVGLLTAIATLSQIGPWLMGVDLAAECRDLEAQIGTEAEEWGIGSAYRGFIHRAYAVPASFEGKTFGELEASFVPARVFAEKLRTGGDVKEGAPDVRMATGDVVVLSGRRDALIGPGNPLRSYEVDDADLLEIPIVTVDVVATRRDFTQRPLAAVVAALEREVPTRGVFLLHLKRAGESLPIGPGLEVARGDVLTLSGAKHHVERVAERLGFADWPSAASDLVAIAAAIAIGGLIGLPALHIAGIDLGLSLPVGVLLGGLVTGWIRSVWPVIGRVPEPALWVFDSLGLTAFLALVGIGAGPGFVDGLRSSGLVLVVAGVLVCAIPNLVTIVVGRYLLRLHPGVLLGICAGGGTSPAALAAVQDVARSRVPTLGYGVSYAVGNVLLALWGSVVVTLLSG